MDFDVNGALLAQALALAIEVRIYLEYWPLNNRWMAAEHRISGRWPTQIAHQFILGGTIIADGHFPQTAGPYSVIRQEHPQTISIMLRKVLT